jgi:DNA-binding HxlR family transcriptional regulator
VLNTRLKALREAGLVDAGEEGYRLTEDGRTLGQQLLALDAWAKDWAERRPAPSA